MVRRLWTISAGRSEESEEGGRLGVESIPPLRRRSRLRAGGRPPPNSHGDHPQRIAPRLCEGPGLPPVRGVRELLVLPTPAIGRSDPGPPRRSIVAARPADQAHPPPAQSVPSTPS